MTQSKVIHLNFKEAQRFAAALENSPKASKKLKKLFKKHRNTKAATKQR